MKIVYYYVVYLKEKQHPEKVEIHLRPFDTEKKAKEYKEKYDKEFGDRFVFSKIKKVDISKNERWL